MAQRTTPKLGGERIPMQTRTTAQTRDRLQEAADRNGRSVSQEMEMRLEQSLMIEDVAEHAIKLAASRELPLIDELGGPETFSLLRDISWLIGGVEHDANQSWIDSPDVRATIYTVLEASLPRLLKMARPPLADDDIVRRALRLKDLLPYIEKEEPEPKLPPNMRMMTQKELRDFFYLRED